ncbi:MAG: TonB-dependent receptor, partial [Pseudomonadota bacterium]
MRKTRHGTSSAVILGLGLSGPVLGQDIQPIDIPSQPLVDAIAELGQETGLHVMAPQEAIANLDGKAVRGPMTPTQALRALVDGLNLSVKSVSADSAVVTHNFVAQNQDNAPFDLGTIVITGELIEREIQDSQTSVVVITADEIEDRSETTLEQVLNRTPGVTADGPAIRGVPANGPIGAPGSRTITTTLDGIRVSDFSRFNQTDLSTWDLEQIEVLRGPQSTQTGRNALFGAINLKSRDPQFFPEYKLRMGAGQNDSYQGSFVANTPLIDDLLAFRLAVDKRETDGFFNTANGTNDRADFEDELTLRAGLRLQPTDRFSAVLKYTFIDDNRGSGSADGGFFPQRIVQSEIQNAQILRGWSADVTYDINDSLTFSSSTIYSDADSFSLIPDDLPRARDVDYDTIEQEFRLNYETGRLRAVVGAFYTKIDTDELTTANGPAAGLPIPFPIAPDATIDARITNTQSRENYALFGEFEYDLTNKWTLIAGARYDVEEFSSSDTDTLVLTNAGIQIPLRSNGPTTSDADYDAFLPKLGIVYNFSEDRSLGFTYQRGYLAGGSGVNLGTIPFETFEFDPEFTDTFELAYRSEFNNGTSILNANLFYTDWTDQQVFVPQSATQGDVIIENAGSSEIWGFEVDYRTTLPLGLQTFVSVAYANTEFTDFVSQDVDLSGNEFPSSPTLTASIG